MQSKEIASSLHSSQRRVAFTLSEVLITLVVIGVIAAITIPTLMNNSKWTQHKSAAWKAKSTLDNVLKLYHAKEGFIPQCGFWEKNPYGTAECQIFSANGKTCLKWTLDNKDLPKDYNGVHTDCPSVIEFISKNLNVVKHCNKNAFYNSCIPEYDGIDTIYKNKNEDTTITETNQATAGWKYFTKEGIKTSRAIITPSMTIITPTTNNLPFYMIDTNGEKGPNKWGHDIIILRITIKSKQAIPEFRTYNNNKFVDKGGVLTKSLLYEENW